MTYAEKLKDPRWQKKRLEILERDQWTCRNCFDKTTTLHVHHLTYAKKAEPWDYPEDYLLTLCEKCHKDIENEAKVKSAEIVDQLRLSLKSTFMWQCARDVFASVDVEKLIFLLYDIGVDTSIELLENEFNRQYVSASLKLEASKQPCAACGSKMNYHEDYNITNCPVCGYRPEYSEAQSTTN
jgi:predicted RNA-binding Zn-ribbon protein involved in translation (DUF1610 family)